MASFEQRGKSWRAIVRLPGGGKTSATFDTKGQAQAWAAEQERRKAVGDIRTGRTVKDLFTAFYDVAIETDSGRWNGFRIQNWLNDPLAQVSLDTITTHDINEWVRRRSKEKSKTTGKPLMPSTVERELNLMSAAFTWGVKVRKWIKANPCHGCLRPEAVRARNRPLLTEHERELIKTSAGLHEDVNLTTKTARVGACFLLALETGMRSGEILRLRPMDYLREQRIVRVAALERGGRKGSRSGRVLASREVPLTAEAVRILDALLASMPADQEPTKYFAYPPYIVGMNDADRDALWRQLRDKSGVADLKFHDTKHEAATRLSKFLDVIELSHALGTKDLKLLRDTYYAKDAERAAELLPKKLIAT